jgi:hypothetical protein
MADAALDDAFTALTITEHSSRRGTKKNATDIDFHMCDHCFHRFRTSTDLFRHIKDRRHNVDVKKATKDYKDAKRERDNAPTDPIAVHNFKIELLKVTSLEKKRGNI